MSNEPQWLIDARAKGLVTGETKTAAAILPEGYKECLDLLDKEIGFNDDRWKY